MIQTLQKILITILLLTTFILVTPSPGNASLIQSLHQSPNLATLFIDSQSDSFNQDQLTPQTRQELQAVRQRRNHDLIEVLDQSQRAELDYYVRTGDDIETVVKKLSLDRDQWDTIQAIVELSRLKIKAILARHAQLIVN